MKKRFSLSKIFVYLVLVVIILFFTVTTDTFLTSKNILNICRQISMIGICSVGMTMVLLTGGIDISVGSIIALVGVVAAKLIGEAGMAIFPAMVIGVVVGALCGLINGIMVAKFDVPALITTLAMQTMARGAAYILTSGIPIYGLPEEIKTLGQGYFFKIPIPVIIMALIFLFGWWLLEQTRFGRYTYAIGGNQEVARLSGINVLKMKIFIYTLSGLFAGLSGVIMLSRINSGQPATSSGFEMDVITGAVLGGISVAGGEGKLVNVIAGVLIMGMLSNGMTLMNLDEYWQWVVKGIVLLLAVTFDNMQRKRNAKVKL
ncbi:MAG: ABC transporter permease [Lachnospiraceae bacterium]|uniref:ABC transporter permease n=1 Tax=Candidatus Merdisoma sp. JLR.KK011 TaxID=3114299 RepID=UPI0029D5C2D5|nr:ABC transporter permease [Lachnospiraceae bacterium]MCI9480210.1 ABC transporter permease [Lachnospiraceae bacterium]MCI9624801.1 ABC transporter permease [Lachnospiraceae bacterium]